MLHSNLNLTEYSINDLKLLLEQKQSAQTNTIEGIKETLKSTISEAVNNARIEIKNLYDLGVYHDDAINTNEKYISIGINLNHKVETNIEDKKFVCNVQLRTKQEELEKAKKLQAKDKPKTIKISSHKIKTSFEKSQL